jgi:hypothetical protein
VFFAFAEFWNDFYAAGGFVLGVLGLVVGVLGFVYTIRQVWKTQTAAEAARAAADEAQKEAKRLFHRFVVGQADQVFSVLCVFVENDNWEAGALRADDLAELLAQLSDGTGDVRDLVELVRDTADTLRRNKKPPANKWADMRKRLNAFLDRIRSPF